MKENDTGGKTESLATNKEIENILIKCIKKI